MGGREGKPHGHNLGITGKPHGGGTTGETTGGYPGEPRGNTLTSVVITGQAARPPMERGRSHGGRFGR